MTEVYKKNQWGEVRDDTRKAGDVIRYHTWPTITHQSIAHHSWNVWRIVHMIWVVALRMEIPAAVVEYIMLHDCGEIRTGDAPYPVKRDNPTLKEVMDILENEALAEQGIHLEHPNDLWAWRIKLAHSIEMLEFGVDEMLLGSRYAAPVMLRMLVWIRQQLENPPASVWKTECFAVQNYIDARLARAARIDGFQRGALELLRDSTTYTPGKLLAEGAAVEPVKPGDHVL